MQLKVGQIFAEKFGGMVLGREIKARDALLTNWEVLQVVEEHLQAKRSSQHHISKTQEKSNVDTIAYEVKRRLSETPAKQLDAEKLMKLRARLDELPLLPAEKLHIINELPRAEVEVHVLVEEIEERFPEDSYTKILDAVNDVVPLPESTAMEE